MALIPFVSKTDSERRAAINTVHHTGMVTKSGLLPLVVHFCCIRSQWFYAVAFSGHVLGITTRSICAIPQTRWI